ncbi:hypothetical protein Hypma_014198 [Hypsizygus marmoreus]|uniref:Uncharacterized protein n=1 Tax=Hypsizygus marmoreus TaxID=39966 RepID=A0A369JK62_HYPMA|nr:hypothetical protein Hypma_014198 [Hypsizygus marmoreus]
MRALRVLEHPKHRPIPLRAVFSNLKVQFKLDYRLLDFDLTQDADGLLALTQSSGKGSGGSVSGALVQVDSRGTDTLKIVSLPIHRCLVAAQSSLNPPNQKYRTSAYNI